jgi:hypothetical protein
MLATVSNVHERYLLIIISFLHFTCVIYQQVCAAQYLSNNLEPAMQRH